MPKEYDDLVDKLKNKKGVDNPYALAHYIQNKQGKTAILTTAKIESLITQYNLENTKIKIASMKVASLKTAFDESEHPRKQSGPEAGQFTCKQCGGSVSNEHKETHAEQHSIDAEWDKLYKKHRPAVAEEHALDYDKKKGFEPDREYSYTNNDFSKDSEIEGDYLSEAIRTLDYPKYEELQKRQTELRKKKDQIRYDKFSNLPDHKQNDLIKKGVEKHKDIQSIPDDAIKGYIVSQREDWIPRDMTYDDFLKNVRHIKGGTDSLRKGSLLSAKLEVTKLRLAAASESEINTEVKKKITYQDCKDWWAELPLSKRQHAVDPNRLEDAKSLEFSKLSHEEITAQGQCDVMYQAYAFRHQDADTSEILDVDIHESPKIWWNTWSVSQRQHMIDPHKMEPESLEMCKLDYDDLSPEQKTRIDDEFNKKNAEAGYKSRSASAFSDSLTKIKDKQHSCSTCGDDDEAQKYAKLVTGSMIEQHSNDSGKYVSYFLLRGNHVNMKNWGVTENSIPQRIGSFRGMPFVITADKFFPTSPYKTIYDHPSTEHFPKLGIAKAGSYNPNDMMLQAEFQEHFRVGSIVDVAKKGADWIAVIKIDPKFAGMQMPPMVSPAIFKLNPAEPDGHISTWTGMHLAGLDEKPAYGTMAIYQGSCDGPGSQCIKQLTAKMAGHKMVLPVCQKAEMMENMQIKIASMRVDLLQV